MMSTSLSAERVSLPLPVLQPIHFPSFPSSCPIQLVSDPACPIQLVSDPVASRPLVARLPSWSTIFLGASIYGLMRRQRPAQAGTSWHTPAHPAKHLSLQIHEIPLCLDAQSLQTMESKPPGSEPRVRYQPRYLPRYLGT